MSGGRPAAGGRPARRLVLASASPARRRLLEDAGFAPACWPSGVDEDLDPELTAEQAVALLAERKLQAVLPRAGDALVLACDSLLELEGRPHGKPAGPGEAVALWRRLGGSTGTLYTGHCLADGRTDRRAAAVAATLVRFRAPAEEELVALVASGEPLDVAGGFTLEGRAGVFVDSLEGSPSNVTGLCLPTFRDLLASLGVQVHQLWR